MTSHLDDTTAPRRDQLAEVIPFSKRHVTGEGTPPSCCRDPRQFPYGLLIVERHMFGGANGFHWFSSEAEAAQFLRSELWNWLPDDDTNEWVRSVYFDALKTTSRIEDDWLIDVSEQQDDVLVVWHGQFDALVNGTDRFAASVVDDFSNLARGPGMQGVDLQGFIEYLAVFRGEVKRGT